MHMTDNNPSEAGNRTLTLDEVADTVVHRVLDLMGIDAGSFRWGSGGADTPK